MKKVLVVIQLIRRGGVELAAINFAQQLDKNGFDVSFLLINPDENTDSLYDELVSEGYNFYSVPQSVRGYNKQYSYLCDLFKKEHFDIVHSHVIFFSGLVVKAAKKNNIPLCISHSHITKWNNRETILYKLYKTYMRNLINRYSDVKLACSAEAGNFLFGKKEFEKDGVIIPNAVNCAHFAYDENKRKKIRAEFGINENTFLIGHVGTVYRIKNQVFLTEIVGEIKNIHPDTLCILVGEEIERKSVEEKARELGITDRIIFAGSRADTDCFYSAFDIMIFPSLHEGFPIAPVEAQASKLPCLISDSVNNKVKFNSNVDFLPLSKSASSWAERALELFNGNREETDIEELVSSFDIVPTVKKLEELYTHKLKG